MSKFGVNIDLSIFFEDERKMVLIMVDPKWENVECLQERVQYLFEVDSVRFINSDGSFLPPQEPIEIVKFCKGLKAFVPKESLEKRKMKKSKKIQQVKKSSEGSDSEETPNLICNKDPSKDESQKKRKYYSLGCGFSASSTPNQAKRIKNISIRNDKLKQINKSSEISSTSEQMPPPPSITTTSSPAVTSKKSKVKKSKSSSVTTGYQEPRVENISNPCELSHECTTKLDEDTSNNSVNNKNGHTPTTKENEILDMVQNVEMTFNDALKARPSSLPSSTFINESKIMQPNKKSTQSLQSPNNKNPFKSEGHVYFNESGEMVTTISSSKNTQKNDKENKKPQTRTIFRCLLKDASTNGLTKPRIFTVKPLSKDPKTKQIVEIQEEIILPAKKVGTNSNKCKNLEITECPETSSSAMQTSQTLQNTKTELLHTEDQERNSLNDTKNTSTIDNDKEQTFTGNMITTKNKPSLAKNPEASMENLETTQSVVEDPVNQDDSILNQTDTKAGADETSVLSIDSVDLSIVIDDDEDDNRKLKKQSQINRKEQSHDLTNDDRGDDSSDIEEISEIIDLNETEDNCNSTVNTSSSTHSLNYSKIVVHKILPFCTDLLELPNIGDIIVFKVPYINKWQKKAETNFMAGKAEYINKRTKSIKILIVDGLIELSNIPSKLLCNLDESQDQIKHLQLKLNEMLEPKIFFRS